MRRRFFDKIGGDLPTDNFMVFDKSVSDPANITISEDFDFLYRLITSGFYRVLCKSAMGGGESVPVRALWPRTCLWGRCRRSSGAYQTTMCGIKNPV
mgnify:CR=1 FL=1